MFRGSALLALVIGAFGLPIVDIGDYGLLVLTVIAALCGVITASPSRWTIAAGLALAGALIPQLLPVPRIQEGYNAFVVKRPGEVLEREVPAPVYRSMLDAFTAQYPPEHWCDAAVAGCWRHGAVPARAFALSADGIYQHPKYSRIVATVDLDHPTWWRAGFWNEIGYHWYGTSDLWRTDGPQTGIGPRLTMPFFVVYEFPAELVGSRLCWQGDVLWEREEGAFDTLPHPSMECRTLAAGELGRRVFGVSIDRANPLTMHLDAAWHPRIVTIAAWLAPKAAVAAVLFVLVVGIRRRPIMALVLTGAAAVVIATVAPSFYGGFVVHDGGDDGLTHEGLGRVVLANLLAGDVWEALRGRESVFYFMPGLRYFRALEKLVFGDTSLGYLAILLVLPAILWSLTRKLLPPEWSVPAAIVFVVTPLGALIGSSYFQYVQQAARGYPDPLGYTLLLGGLAVLVIPERMTGAGRGLAAGALLALAIFVRPNLMPAGAVLLAAEIGRGWSERRWDQAFGLAAGLSLVLVMPIHNWIFGQEFVPLTAAASNPANLQAPPSLYAAALAELLRFDSGEGTQSVLRHIEIWLRGPTGWPVMVPAHIASLAMLLHVAVARSFGRRLHVVTWVALGQHAALLFWQAGGRHAFLAWLLTGLVALAWWAYYALPALARRMPTLAQRSTGSFMIRYRALCQAVVR